MGGQQPDHQRRHALAARRRHLLRRRRRRHGRRHGGAAPGRRTSPRWSPRASRPPATPDRPRTPCRWSARRPAGDGDWDADPAETSIEVFADFAPALGQAFGEARDRDELLFGFAEHSMRTTYLGTSTGLRLRTTSPPAGSSSTARAPTSPARSGPASAPATSGTCRWPTSPPTSSARWAGRQRRIELPAGRYETLLPPSAVSDLMIYLYWTMEARDADEGRNVFAARWRQPDRRAAGRRCR